MKYESIQSFSSEFFYLIARCVWNSMRLVNETRRVISVEYQAIIQLFPLCSTLSAIYTCVDMPFLYLGTKFAGAAVLVSTRSNWLKIKSQAQ